MARGLRIEYAGAFYHVLNRGQRRDAIVQDDRDRERLVGTLGRAAELFDARIHSYCLMTNHFHLIVETPQANLSRAMHWLHASYAGYYNRRHHCSGHVFQGRFKAILLDAGTYLEALSRYIHCNPVRAGMVARPWDYPWSSCRCFLGTAQTPGWLQVNPILGGFARGKRAARRRYASYLSTADSTSPFDAVLGGSILGTEGFVQWVRDTFLRGRNDDPNVAGLTDLQPRPSVDKIVSRVAGHYAVKPADILTKGRKGNRQRDVAIYLARELAGLPASELGRCFGGLTGAGIAMRCTHVLRRLPKDRRLAREIARLRTTISNNE